EHRQLQEALADFANRNDRWIGLVAGAGEKRQSIGTLRTQLDVLETRGIKYLHQENPPTLLGQFRHRRTDFHAGKLSRPRLISQKDTSQAVLVENGLNGLNILGGSQCLLVSLGQRAAEQVERL